MKLLAIHTVNWLGADHTRESAVDIWRCYRPIQQLKQHTDWHIEEQPTFIKGIDKYANSSEFNEEEFEKAAKYLGQFDIVWSSYFPDTTPYLLMKVVHDRYGTKFVLDCDDDLFHVNPDNPFWTKTDHEHVWYMQNMIKDVGWISTTTERLADTFRQRRRPEGHADDTVTILPNYMSDDYKHGPVDNGDKVVIGYFGGASHFADLNETRCMRAIKRLMRKYRNVHFQTVNMPVVEGLPKARSHYIDGKRGLPWITELFPTLNFDIAIVPLQDNIFNYGKSNIKWMECTRMGAATVCSNVPPYSDLSDDVTVKVSNKYYDWYNALEALILDADKRKQLVENAQKQLASQRLEDHWPEYKEFFERIHAA